MRAPWLDVTSLYDLPIQPETIRDIPLLQRSDKDGLLADVAPCGQEKSFRGRRLTRVSDGLSCSTSGTLLPATYVVQDNVILTRQVQAIRRQSPGAIIHHIASLSFGLPFGIDVA